MDYGFRSWTQLMHHVAETAPDPAARPLLAAVRSGDVEAVRRCIAQGANPQLGDGRESPLHAAARRGPLAVVEALIEAGAMDSRQDAAGRTPLEIARRGRARDRRAIVALLDRDADADPSFRAAIRAVHRGDVAELARLLDAEPRLLRDRILAPQAYRASARRGYFRDPKLVWYVANNPTLIDRMPPNIVDVANVMLERGVDRADLDYTLGLVMTSSAAREAGHQRDLVRVLRVAGATATREAILSTGAHRELDVLRALIEDGEPMTAAIAAALGDLETLRAYIRRATDEDLREVFALAVINENPECVRLALQAGADANAYLPAGAHGHGTALHQAAANDDAPMIDLLLAHGARLDLRDTLWDATPLGWAIHEGNTAARAALEAACVVTPAAGYED